jgi:hypothetical protein
MTTAKQKWGAWPKPAAVAIVNPEAADAFVAGGAEHPVPTPLPEAKPAEKVKMKRLTIDIEPDLHTKLKTKAAQQKTTIADMARQLLQDLADRE